MTITAPRTASIPATEEPQRRRFTADEYHRMAEAGILGEEERVELLDGEILLMAPISGDHWWPTGRLTMILAPGVGPGFIVGVQSSIHLFDDSEPEPDLVIVPAPSPGRTTIPRPSDVLLVVEVSVSSLAYDTGRKLKRYAAAGIPELWVFDIAGERLLVYRDPAGEEYGHKQTFLRGQSVAPLAFPTLFVAVNDVLGRKVVEKPETEAE